MHERTDIMEKIKVNMLNDVFFKSLLCDDRHKELTLNFLNSTLNRTGDKAFYDIEFLDKEIDPIIEAGKVSILDIRAKMNDDTYVNVEEDLPSRRSARPFVVISGIFSVSPRCF